jgi:quinol monooxygenase YgiN
MYVVTVKFEIKPENLDEFQELMKNQASNSLENEAGCFQFDVCYGCDQANLCFLYEKYSDREAFEDHLASPHFKEFDSAVQPFVISKDVGTWEATVAC